MAELYPDRLTGLGWAGGKSPVHSHGYARWIVDKIPYHSQQSYFEPFAGMLGILLQRPPCYVEVVNDTNGDLVNWWRQVRDNPKEMQRLWVGTPNSRSIFDEAKVVLAASESSDIERAWAFQYLVTYSLLKSPHNASWSMPTSKRVTSLRYDRESHWSALSERLRYVHIENSDAIEILERTAEFKNCFGGRRTKEAIVYCDPPYRNTQDVNETIYEGSVDYDAMTELLLAHKCKVAVSGVEGDWDHLGWYRHEHSIRNSLGVSSDKKTTKRVECLWTNYQTQSTLFEN